MELNEVSVRYSALLNNQTIKPTCVSLWPNTTGTYSEGPGFESRFGQ